MPLRCRHRHSHNDRAFGGIDGVKGLWPDEVGLGHIGVGILNSTRRNPNCVHNPLLFMVPGASPQWKMDIRDGANASDRQTLFSPCHLLQVKRSHVASFKSKERTRLPQHTRSVDHHGPSASSKDLERTYGQSYSPWPPSRTGNNLAVEPRKLRALQVEAAWDEATEEQEEEESDSRV